MDEITVYETIRPEPPASAEAMRAAARHRLSTAINFEARTNGRVSGRKAAGRWFSGARGKTIIGVAGVAAAAAAATVIVLPVSSTMPPKTTPLAGPSAKPTMKAHVKLGSSLPSTVPTSAPPVTYSFGPASTTLTASYVLDKAAAAIGSQTATGANWAAGAYWHTEQQVIRGGCVFTDNIWTASDGNGVGEGDGPKPAQQGRECGASSRDTYPISTPSGSSGSLFFSIGQKNYTSAQLDALPTNPAKLYPIVKADEQLPFSSTDPGAPKSGQSDLFQSIWNLVTSEPVPATLQKALYEVAAEIPGVSVEGNYTDSLGRTGTALHIGMWTMAIDSSNGQVLAMSQAAGGPVTVCGTKGCYQQPGPGAVTSVYISAGWASASSVPAVAPQKGANGSGGAGVAPDAGAPAASAPSHQ